MCFCVLDKRFKLFINLILFLKIIFFFYDIVLSCNFNILDFYFLGKGNIIIIIVSEEGKLKI